MAESNKVVGFFKGVIAEFNKIMWPNFETLMKQSFTVIVVTLIVGGIVALIDLMYQVGIDFIIG
jgi:preprotein translocase subunit SecE